MSRLSGFIVIIFSFLCFSFYLPSLSRNKSSVISASNCVPSLLFFCNLGVKLSFTNNNNNNNNNNNSLR